MKVWLFMRIGYPRRITGSYLLAGKDYDRILGKEIYDEVVDFLRGVEGYGFDGIFFPEHHSRAANGLSPSPNLFVAMTAVLTQQMKIGLMGNCLPLHHPVRLGEELALLDNLSNGRLVVGMTRGGDFWAFNIASANRASASKKAGRSSAKVGRPRSRSSTTANTGTWITWLFCRGLCRSRYRRPGFRRSAPRAWNGRQRTASVWPRHGRRPSRLPRASSIIGAMQASTAAGNRVRNIAWFLAISMSARPMLKPGRKQKGISSSARRKNSAARRRIMAAALPNGYFSKQATAFKKSEHIGVMEIKNWSFEQLQDAGISIVGDPDYVTEQILRQCRMMGTDKIMMRPVFGRLRLNQVKKSLELMAKEVLPNLNKEKIVIPAQTAASAM